MANYDNIRKALLKKHHSVDDYGIWNIYGEDPNCDFGGPHSTPFLETVEGRYENVVEYALALPHFFTWGGGGRVEKQKSNNGVKIIGNKLKAEEIIELRHRREGLERELAQIDKKLKGE